jgi:toxin YxiD
MKFYNQKTREIAPKSIQNILKNKDVIKAINKGLKFLGE